MNGANLQMKPIKYEVNVLNDRYLYTCSKDAIVAIVTGES